MEGAERSVEALCTLIRATDPKRDAEATAAALLNQFGSLAPIVESVPEDLRRVAGVTENTALLLSLIPQLARYVCRERLTEHPVLNTCLRAGEFLQSMYLGEHYEHLYMLCLDQTGTLMECVLVQSGTIDETPFYLRNVLEAATRSGAYAIVLSHNHPNGTDHPSAADCDSTRRAVDALEPLGILVLDHIIIADGEVISVRGDGFLPETLFARQKRSDPLMTNWLTERAKGARPYAWKESP